MVHTHPLPPIDRRNNTKQKTRYQKTTIIIKQRDFQKQNIFRWYLISQTPDIFQIKPKEHNKQLYRTNQIGKVGTTNPKNIPQENKQKH